MEQVIDYCTNGWEYGIEKTDKLKQQISIPVLESVKRKLTKGSEGDWLDIHAVNRGQLATAWTKKKRTNSRGPKRFQLVCKLGGAGYVSGEALLWRGVTCMALAQAIMIAAVQGGRSIIPNPFIKMERAYSIPSILKNTPSPLMLEH